MGSGDSIANDLLGIPRWCSFRAMELNLSFMARSGIAFEQSVGSRLPYVWHPVGVKVRAGPVVVANHVG